MLLLIPETFGSDVYSFASSCLLAVRGIMTSSESEVVVHLAHVYVLHIATELLYMPDIIVTRNW